MTFTKPDTAYWDRKIMEYMHDPLDKIFQIKGHEGRAALPESGGSLSVAHHRRQHHRARCGPVDQHLYFPQFHAAVGPADLLGSREAAGVRGLAQLRAVLRSDIDGLAPELHPRMG